MTLDEIEVGQTYVINDSNPDWEKYVGREVRVTAKYPAGVGGRYPIEAYRDEREEGPYLLYPSELSPRAAADGTEGEGS